MGSWNETCVLTHLPICAGMPVVVLNAVYGPQFHSIGNSSSRIDLLFGLPVKGNYNDYGGIESVANPDLDILHEKAFLNSGYYKKTSLSRGFNSIETWFIASHPDTLWALADQLQFIYYSDFNISLSEVNSPDHDAGVKKRAAFKQAEVALKKLGELLKTEMFSNDLKDAQNQLFSLFENVFDSKEKAWFAWNVIRENGLFATHGKIFMHHSAYQAVVNEFGNREVGYYQGTTCYKIRDCLSMRLDEYLEKFTNQYTEFDKSFKSLYPGLSEFDHRKKVLRSIDLDREYSELSPMTNLWLASKLSLIGHFWGGAMPEEILSVVSKDSIIDYFVFQWARHYLRVDLVKSNSGSQNQEVVLSDKVFNAVIKMFKNKNLFVEDYDAVLRR